MIFWNLIEDRGEEGKHMEHVPVGKYPRFNKKGKIRVGIPRALIYYKFQALWETFFKSLGAQVIVSSPTSKPIKNLGVRHAPDEDCYNSKLYYGHLMSIKDKVDCFFIPRLGSDHPVHVGCPKFISLAEVIHSMYPDLPPIIMPYYSKAKSNHGRLRLLSIAFSIGWVFTKNPIKILRALFRAVAAQKVYKTSFWLTNEELERWKRGEIEVNDHPKLRDGEQPLRVALAAHSYVMNDPFASLNIRKKLAAHGVSLITSEQLPREIVKAQMDKLDYNFYFEYEREILGTALYFIEDKSVDGIVQICTFCCGPDSIAGEMALQYSKRDPQVPLLQLTFDELTGEAGLNTRIEAFTDMLRRRQLQRRQKKFQSHSHTLAA
ncbi:MAG: acyl-CoA dehydratase activase-related protein [Promethearchaeota archaeon]